MPTTHGWVQVECTGRQYRQLGGVAEQAIRGEFAAYIPSLPAVQTTDTNTNKIQLGTHTGEKQIMRGW